MKTEEVITNAEENEAQKGKEKGQEGLRDVVKMLRAGSAQTAKPRPRIA